MDKLNSTFYIMVIVTILYMVAIMTGMLDHEEGSFYLGGAGFLILFYAIRTYLMLNKKEMLNKNRLNGIDKLCGYIGILNGFLLLAIVIISFIISLVKLKLPTIGEIVVLTVCSIYGYSILYYIRRTLKTLA